MAPAFMKVSCLAMLAMALMAPPIGLMNGVCNTALNMVISVADGVAARIALSLLFGYTLEMGVLGFYLGNSLAGFVTVIWGGLYFLRGRWAHRSVLNRSS